MTFDSDMRGSMTRNSWPRQQEFLGLTYQQDIGILAGVAPTAKFAYFGKQVREGMRRADIRVADVAAECGVSRETVRLWRKGESVARDKSLRKLADMIGVDPAELRYEPGRARQPALPQVQGEHVTDEDELALLRAYRGLTKEWARNALRARAVELLEKFGEPGPHNPHGQGTKGTQ